MPRKQIILSDIFPYHVRARSNNKEFFSLPLEILWPLFIEKLELVKVKYGCCLHAFVLMNNHYHLIISTPLANIDDVMEYLNREVAKEANRLMGRINHFFGGPYQWSLIADDLYYWNAVKYVFRNPVKAGLCSSVLDYKYSSLNTEVKEGFWEIKQDCLDWLDESFSEDQDHAITKALRRREFKLPKNKNGQIVKLDELRPEKVRSTFSGT